MPQSDICTRMSYYLKAITCVQVGKEQQIAKNMESTKISVEKSGAYF